MNRTRIITIAAIVITIAGLAYFRLSPRSNDTQSLPPAGASPVDTDPAMTTEPAPQLKEDGIVPLPIEAVGRSSPEDIR